MSDFLLGTHSCYPAENIRKLCFTPHAEGYLSSHSIYQLSLSRNDKAELWQPAYDSSSDCYLAILGRVALPPEAWDNAKSLPYEGGLAAKYLLSRWLNNAQSFYEYLNGYYAIIIFESKRLHIITDRLGVYSVYKYSDIANLKFSSHPDILAKWIRNDGGPLSLNLYTIAQALATGSSFSQGSYYEEIDRLKPASHYIYSHVKGENIFSRSTYWQKSKSATCLSKKQWSSRIALAIKNSTRIRSQNLLGKVALLLSGGADSRAILYSLKNPGKIDTITFYDVPNSESKTSKKLALLANSQHSEWKREYEHYGKMALQNVILSGGMWSINDAHYLSFGEKLSNSKWGVLMTGCYADYLLKGLALNKKQKLYFGKSIPIYEKDTKKAEFYQPHYQLNEFWQEKINTEYRLWLVKNDLEDKRVRPLAQECDAMGRAYLMRYTPWEPVFCDTEIIELYSSMPEEIKLNYLVYANAVQSLLPKKVKKIRNNNTNAKLDASHHSIAINYLVRRSVAKLGRICKKLLYSVNTVTNHGSWPDFNFYVSNSEIFDDLWHSVSENSREIIVDLLGWDPWLIQLKDWQENEIDLLLRILTISIWLDYSQQWHHYKTTFSF